MRRLTPLLAGLVLAACSQASSPTPRPAPVTATPATPTASFTPIPTDDAVPLLPPPPGGTPVAGTPPTAGVPWFLTIGDSITSGYTRDPARTGVNSGWPVQLEHLLATSGRPWRLYDTACPGETTETYRSLCPERSLIPFLAAASQHDVATAAITAHLADLRFIAIDLGSNDLLRARGAEPGSALAALGSRLDAILAELRRLAPGVPLIVANYYDPFATAAPDTLPAVRSINAALAGIAARHGAAVADFFSAINGPGTGDLCASIDCPRTDVHPTVAGHGRLAAAALAVAPRG